MTEQVGYAYPHESNDILKVSAEIPVHHLPQTDFYASYTDGIKLGEFGVSHRIDFFAIIWFLEDAGVHYIDFEPYPIKKNMVHLLARNQVHSLPGDAPNARTIIFSKRFFDSIEDDDLRFLFAPFANAGINIPDELVEPLAHLFDLMQLESKLQHGNRLLHLYTNAFLVLIQRLNYNSEATVAYQDDRVRKLFELIASHYKTQKFANFYADQIGLTAKRLNQLVKEKLDLTVSQLIYNYTLIEAKREISHSVKSFKEIAIELGFREQSYFSRFFKNRLASLRSVSDRKTHSDYPLFISR